MNSSRDRQDELETIEVALGFQRGESACVEQVRQRVRRIVGFRGYRIPREERRDLVQEVMVQLWQQANRARFEAGPRFWGLVELVASRRCIDWFRARKETLSLDAMEVEPAAGRENPLAETLSRERSERAWAALAQIEQPCRELILLHVGLNRTYAEIAGILGKSEGALRVQMYRCVRSLRAVLGESGAQEPQAGPRGTPRG